MNRLLIVLSFLFMVVLSPRAEGAVLKSDTVWAGEIAVTEDVLVPEGVALTILPGTIIRVSPSESTKVDPEYLSPMTEITVRGTIRAEGNEGSPISFLVSGTGTWAGIVVDGGTAVLNSCRVQDAETGIYLIDGVLSMEKTVLQKNRYGLIAQGGKALASIRGGKVTLNDYGVFSFSGAAIEMADVILRDNKKTDRHSFDIKARHERKEYSVGNKEISRQYADEVLLGDTVWRGRIIISGLIRLPAGSRLIITPGTVIEFKRLDTDGDGIGESGLMVQGVIIAKGTAESRIIFRSAEKLRRMGDWDSINIMNSDGARNLLEYCQVEDAYRGLHFHFSDVAVRYSVLRNNYRGIQFQESTADITGNYLYSNKSGLQGRDSQVIFSNNEISNNHYGAVFFRVSLNARGNRVLNNLKEGMKIREGIPLVEENFLDGNRFGLQISDLFYGSINRNVISHNAENGISMKAVDNIEVAGNFIGENGLNGIHVQDSAATIKGNLVSGNGERGLGILSFSGVIIENNIVKNGLYAVELEGKEDVLAPMNWWATEDMKATIHDKEAESWRGKVIYKKASKHPLPFPWPLNTISTDITWYGDILLQNSLTVLAGSTLKVAPGTRLTFSGGAGLKVKGKILASGERGNRILFTSSKKTGASDWDELLLEYADGSLLSHCDFQYATWGVHSHFTNLVVTDSSFRNNYGGIRFRSGPVEVRRSLFEGNSIGIRAYRGSALVAENIITGNETGIFVREKGAGLRINRNNIFRNSSYNLRLGDFNDEDVSAAENWWGDGDPADTIFDEKNEPGLGRAIIEPYATQPFEPEIMK